MTKTVLIITSAIIIPLSIFFLVGSDEEAAIRKLLTDIEELTEFEQPLSRINAVSRLSKLEKHLMSEINIKAFHHKRNWEFQITNRDKLKSMALYGSKTVKSHSVVLDQMNISIKSDEANVNLQVISEGINEGGRFKEILSVRANLKKSDKGNWLVSSAQAEFMTPDYE